MNILYLDDYINFYYEKNQRKIIFMPYKDTLKKGHIINRDKFIKSFRKMAELNKITNNIFLNKLIIIINSSWSIEDKKIITEIFEELNYKKIEFINEISYLKINKNDVIFNFNQSYFYLYYKNNLGNIEYAEYEKNLINIKLINDIIKIIKKKNIFIYGKNTDEMINLLSRNSNYYYFENSNTLLLDLIISNKKV